MNEEILGRIVALRKKFDDVIDKHSDDEGFVNAVNANLEENEFVSVEKIREDYERNADSERLLKIGIVGAVKAGKSSLLNALFFEGNDILPKAATPMTAALTELSYGEQCKITVDFFTEKDIQELQKGHEKYISLVEKVKKEEFVKAKESWLKAQQRRNRDFDGSPSSEDEKRWKEVAEKNAKRKADENVMLSGAYSQYESIKSASVPRKTESETFAVESVGQIAGKLEDYVGSSGKYMPFTSRVSIELPINDLQGISVIDTPGFNDPVPSRDDRARQSLRQCDVVLILSPARQFLSATDKDVMSKITTKQGIRELYLIQSQIDNQLYNMEVIDETQGDLDVAVKKIVSTLNNTAKNNLCDINESGAFNELINETEKRSFPTSGICQSMAETFSERQNWDDGRKHVWENLCKNYPDYFSNSDEDTSKASLLKLGNIEKIHDAIIVVKDKKAEIFAQRLADFERKYENACKGAKEKTLEYIQIRQEELEKTDIKKIEKQIAALQKMYDSIAPDLDYAFEDTVREWYDETKSDYSGMLSGAQSEAKDKIAGAEGSRERTWTTGHLFWKKYHSETVITVNESAVRTAIKGYVDDYNDNIPHFMESQIYRLTKKVIANIIKTWSDAQATSNVEFGEESSITKIKNKVRTVMSEMNFQYNLEYEGATFDNLRQSRKCLEEAEEFVSNMHSELKARLKDVLDEILSKCKNCGFSKKVLDSYVSQLEKSKKDLEQPKLAIENFKRMEKEIEEIQ